MFGGEDVGVASLEGNILLTLFKHVSSTISRKPLLLPLSESDSCLLCSYGTGYHFLFLTTLFCLLYLCKPTLRAEIMSYSAFPASKNQGINM